MNATTIQFKASDFNDNIFVDNDDCAVARALKRTFPGKEVKAFTEVCYIDGQKYAFRNVTINNPDLDYKTNKNYFGSDMFNIMKKWFNNSTETAASIDIYPIPNDKIIVY